MKTIISRLTMQKRSFAFRDMVEGVDVFYYVDKYGDIYLAPATFYPWTYRTKL